jgi:hypothetical protein
MYDTGLEVSKKTDEHQMKVIDQRDNDTEGKKFPFSITGVEGIHKHPRTEKLETAGLYSNLTTGSMVAPLSEDARNLHEELLGICEMHKTKHLDNHQVQEAKENWAVLLGAPNKDAIRRKWHTCRQALEDAKRWSFKALPGKGKWNAVLEDDF